MLEKRENNKRVFFYTKEKKEIVPSSDEDLNSEAKSILDSLYSKKSELKIPKKFIENWEKVSLYNPAGDITKANAILMNPEDGAYSLANKLNGLTGKEWIKFTCSWFIFNALQKDLKAEKELDPDTKDHPATYSPTMIESFINFFTKEGQTVLDPFLGIGSTTEAAKRTNRVGYGTELNPKYYNLALKRNPELKDNIFNIDARKIKELNLPPIDFSISSPPYWDMLNRSTRDFKKNRDNSGLDVKYSDSNVDIGNIESYDEFLDSVCEIYLNLYDVLKTGAYLVIIVKNVKKGGKLYPLAWDMAIKLGKKYALKDEKIWIQDKLALAPYGYPSSWTSNILHHYCIVLRKE